MKAVIFVETSDKKVLFKCDTFWSKSENPRDAKIYSDNPSELKGWLQSVMPHNIYKDMLEKVKDRYDGANLGYFIPKDELFENSFCLKDGVVLSDLGKPTYLWSIKMNSVSDWVITKEHKGDKDEKESVDVDNKSLCEFLDYRSAHRDEILREVLKEKESE